MFRACLKRLFVFGLLLASLSFAIASARASSLDDFRRAVSTGAHHSLSGQFIVHDPPPLAFYPVSLGNDTNIVRLDPTLLGVSCERIKKELLNRLGARDQWKSKIFIDLHHAQNLDEPVVVTPARYDREWMYRLEMPDALDRQRFISAIVEVLLLEMANRDSLRSSEIPLWLSSGMSREVTFTSQEDLIIEPPRKFERGVAVARLTRTNLLEYPLVQSHQSLMTSAPLTLAQLTWPRAGQFDGDSGETYRSSAQLFVHDLLQLKDGRAAMLAFIPQLSQYLNWQIGFLRAFHADFANQLELEKWWALRVVQFTGRDLAQTWPTDVSWLKLDEVIRPSIENRPGRNNLPVQTQVTLQTIIKDWDIPRQTKLLQEKSQQLLLVRLHVAPDLINLVDDYRKVVESYLRQRDSGNYIQMGRTIYAPRLDDLARDTIRTLDALELRRQQMRPNPQSTPAITSNIAAKP